MYAKFVFLCVFAWSSINLVQSSLENKTLQSVKSNDTLCEFCVQLIHSDNKTQIATNSTDLIEIRDSVSGEFLTNEYKIICLKINIFIYIYSFSITF